MSRPTVGILGAGQLGLMLAQAAQPLGIRCLLLDPAPHPPAKAAGKVIKARYTDKDSLAKLADACDVITYEFENVPVEAAQWLKGKAVVHPSPKALAIAQDRLKEKRFFQSLGIPVADFHAVKSGKQLAQTPSALLKDGILKTRSLGYDGKGQARVTSLDQACAAWEEMDRQHALIEARVPFIREASILAVRGPRGETAFYPLVENQHREGILAFSKCPVPELQAYQVQAQGFAQLVMETLDYVGVLCLEFFITARGLVVNEMAPRVHNSGHFTIEGAQCSQFENHLRAVLGLPLGSTALRGHSAMLNLVGTMPDLPALLAIPGIHVHDYGKSPKPKRKLGHLTLTADSSKELPPRLAAATALL